MTTSRDDERQSGIGSGVDARDVHIREWTGPELSARVNDAMAIYVLAMNYPGYAGSQRSVTTRRHTTDRNKLSPLNINNAGHGSTSSKGMNAALMMAKTM